MKTVSAAPEILLHGYFRSSASWRVRIALALKQLPYVQRTHHLRRGDQRSAAYLEINPQGLVPAIVIDGQVLTQSLAICEYLDELVPEPTLLGPDPLERARIRGFALAIACDIHPLQNLKILERLRALGVPQAGVEDWIRTVIGDGLTACVALLPATTTPFCFGDQATLADICLIPQMANARRLGVPITWPALERIERHCLAHPAFADSAPDRQPDAEDVGI